MNCRSNIYIGRVAIIGCLLMALAPAAGAVSPHHDWRTIRADNFIIVYSEGEAAIAARALRIAGQVAERLDSRFNWTPREPVRIVLTDDIGLSNGFTTVLPNNIIEIYISPPNRLTSGLARFGDWLRLVITHEYTHIIQLSMTRGAPAVLQTIFGRHPVLFPGRFQPTLLIEGLAVHEESKPSLGIGRSDGPLFAMEMRAELNAGLKPWSEVAMSGVTDWPAGNIPYLYGSYFYEFLADTEGEKTLPRLVNHYSKNLIPFRIGDNFFDTTGHSLDQLWQAYTNDLHANHQQPPYPSGTRLTEGKRLTHFGYNTQSVRAASDGRVFFIREDYRRHPALMVWRPGRGARELAPVFTPAAIDFNDRAGILLARPEICHEYKLYFDLYRINPDSGDMTRLTHCGRYRYASWSPDGRRIAAVHVALGINSLVLLNADGGQIDTLWTGDNHQVLGQIDWSPDQDEIVAPVWRPTRGWALEQFDIDSRRWRVLVDNAGLVGDPQYTADGQAVLFTSDAGGVYNLRRLDIETEKVVTVTHVSTGAFSPSESGAGGPIYYLGYTSQGYDLFKLPADQTVDQPLEPVSRDELPPPTAPPTDTPPSKPYSPWSSLAPTRWTPELTAGPDFVRVGAATAGSDALQLHSYSADVSYGAIHHLFGGSFYYQYADRFTAGVERRFRYDTYDENLLRVRRQDAAQAIYRIPFKSYEQVLTPMAGIAYQSDRDAVRKGFASLPFETTVVGAALGWNTSHRWPISISPNNGQNLLLVAETSRPFGGDFDGNAYRLDWHGYLPLGGESVLMLHYREAYATSGARPFNLGGATFSSFTPAEGAIFNHHDFRFRGYPSGLAALTGHRLRQATIEGRIGIIRPETAWHGIGLHQMSLRLFGSTGAAWNGGGAPPDYHESAGVEAVFDLNLAYRFNVQLTVGFAHGFDSSIGENQWYASIGLPFGS